MRIVIEQKILIKRSLLNSTLCTESKICIPLNTCIIEYLHIANVYPCYLVPQLILTVKFSGNNTKTQLKINPIHSFISENIIKQKKNKPSNVYLNY